MTAPARSPVDDALDRLDKNPLLFTPQEKEDLATVREALERLREERDDARAMTRIANTRAAQDREAAEAEVQRLTEEREQAWDFGQEMAGGKQAAEAKVQRLTEGLRDIAEDAEKAIKRGTTGGTVLWRASLERCRFIANRALLAASPDGAKPEGREGMVNAYDHENRYVGCIGEHTWRWLIDHPEIDLPGLLRAYELFRPGGANTEGGEA